MKTWKKVASAALAAMVFASLTAGCGGGDKKKEAANSNEIVVGASFELTGNVANYGKSTLSGLKMAFDEATWKNFGAHWIGNVPPLPATCITIRTTAIALPISPKETVSA